MKNIILLEHNNPKPFLLSKAREKGYRIIMVAKKQNEIFSQFLEKEDVIITDVFNTQSVSEDVLSWVQRRDIHIDAVGTFSEDLVIATSDLAALLECRGVGQLASRRSSGNKLAMRRKLKENSEIMQPTFTAFNIFNNDAEAILKNFPKPCVVKPIFGTSSHGVLMIENDSYDFSNIVENVRLTVNPNERESFRRFTGNMLIEEYIPGKLISIDGFVSQEKVSLVGSIEFIMGKEPYFTQIASYIPARLSEKENRVCYHALNTIINQLDFKDTAFHAEFRINDKGAFLVEIAARMAGALIHETYNKVYDIDMIHLMYRCWLGEDIPVQFIPRGTNYHCLVYPDISEKTLFMGKDGLESLISKHKEIWHFKMIAQVGAELKVYPEIPTPLFEYSCFDKDLKKIDHVREELEKSLVDKI